MPGGTNVSDEDYGVVNNNGLQGIPNIRLMFTTLTSTVPQAQ